jgi:Trk K+ transport system NAD-binding subunit
MIFAARRSCGTIGAVITILLRVLLRKQAPSLPVTALVSSPAVREALRDLGIQQSVSARELVSRTLAANLETPHAGEMISQLVGNREAPAEIEVADAVGKRLSAVRTQRAGLVLPGPQRRVLPGHRRRARLGYLCRHQN